MEKLKMLILCSHKDYHRLKRLISMLEKMRVHAELPDDLLVISKPFSDQIASLITSAKIIVLFVSEHSVKSEYLRKEILFAYESAKERDKKIIPIVEWEDYTIKIQNLNIYL